MIFQDEDSRLVDIYSKSRVCMFMINVKLPVVDRRTHSHRAPGDVFIDEALHVKELAEGTLTLCNNSTTLVQAAICYT